jgi:hypothetical protein
MYDKPPKLIHVLNVLTISMNICATNRDILINLLDTCTMICQFYKNITVLYEDLTEQLAQQVEKQLDEIIQPLLMFLKRYQQAAEHGLHIFKEKKV